MVILRLIVLRGPACQLRALPIFVFRTDNGARNSRIPDQEINQVGMPFGCSGRSPHLLPSIQLDAY